MDHIYEWVVTNGWPGFLILATCIGAIFALWFKVLTSTSNWIVKKFNR